MVTIAWGPTEVQRHPREVSLESLATPSTPSRKSDRIQGAKSNQVRALGVPKRFSENKYLRPEMGQVEGRSGE